MKARKMLSVIICMIMTMFVITPTVSANTYADGWHKDSNGQYFYTVDNSKLTGWYTIDDSTYYFSTKGVMQTGWLNVGDTYYYLKSNGKMAKNTTLKIGGKNYSFDSDGKYYVPKSTATTKSNTGTKSYTQTTTKASTEAALEYVLNTNTKKFHKTGCKSVKQMKDKNKKYYTGTRDDVIGMGYEPCKNCKP